MLNDKPIQESEAGAGHQQTQGDYPMTTNIDRKPYYDETGCIRVPCPECGGPTELTYRSWLICREYGSDHYLDSDGALALEEAAKGVSS